MSYPVSSHNSLNIALREIINTRWFEGNFVLVHFDNNRVSAEGHGFRHIRVKHEIRIFEPHPLPLHDLFPRIWLRRFDYLRLD